MPALIERARGALLGLAAGDAVGTTLEFQPPGTFAPIDGMAGGGPFDLPAGAWTDDTSMALCLAESLLACDGFDPVDQLRRYVRWYREGHLSSTGRCFDIGTATRAALERFEATGEPYPGDADPGAAGNGPLMKLAPIAIAFVRDLVAARELAAQSARTTHGAPAAVAAAQDLAVLLVRALRGESKAALLGGAYRDRAVRGHGHAVASLEAALWAVDATDDFRSAVLAAANLGDDADTTAAIAGQLAGALYGEQAIPPEWRARLVMRERIEDFAQRLVRELPLRRRFKHSFGVPLPRERVDGTMLAAGWTIRWRWDGPDLLVFSTHRMAGDTYARYCADGVREIISEETDPPAEMEPQTHGGPARDLRTELAWRADGGDWVVLPL